MKAGLQCRHDFPPSPNFEGEVYVSHPTPCLHQESIELSSWEINMLWRKVIRKLTFGSAFQKNLFASQSPSVAEPCQFTYTCLILQYEHTANFWKSLQPERQHNEHEVKATTNWRKTLCTSYLQRVKENNKKEFLEGENSTETKQNTKRSWKIKSRELAWAGKQKWGMTNATWREVSERNYR